MALVIFRIDMLLAGVCIAANPGESFILFATHWLEPQVQK